MDSFLTEGKKDLQYSVQFSIASWTNKNHSFAFGATKKKEEKKTSLLTFIFQLKYPTLYIKEERHTYILTYKATSKIV